MRYVVTGATSGTGNAVLARLAQKVGAERITCLVRPTSDTTFLQQLGVELRVGDVTAPETLAAVVDRAAIYLDMTHPKYYAQSLGALTAAGVERAYFVTTTGIFSRFHRCSEIYKSGEERIRRSGLTYTILRPSMIYGSMRDKNMHRLIRFLDRYPVFPLFNAGRSLMQPVYVDDLADGIVAAIDDTRTEGQDYNLAGPTGITYGEIIDTILTLLNRRVLKLPINTMIACHLVRALQWLPRFPINDEQVLRLQEDKVFDISKAVAELGYHPRPFADGIRLEIDAMRTAGVLSSPATSPGEGGSS